jgi:hypothetical protein
MGNGSTKTGKCKEICKKFYDILEKIKQELSTRAKYNNV